MSLNFHLAASTPQTIGVFIAATFVAGWLLYVLVNSRRRDADSPTLGAEIELAPNRKRYFADDELEGPRLERYLGWALLLLVVSAVGPIAYWLNEPSRQAGAIEEFDAKAVERGRQLFLPTNSPEHGAHFGCATCHGARGEGGTVPGYAITDYLGRTRLVSWEAPPLDTVRLRYPMPEPGKTDQLREVIAYGRKNTPMPAWGVEGGGPMNAQQVDDLVAYVESITISPDDARARARTEAIAEAERLGRTGGDDGLALDGEALFNTTCARCHTQGWSYGEPTVPGGGAFGFNLTNGVTLRQFPDFDGHVDFVATGSQFATEYGVRGVGTGRMPGFSSMLTADQIRAIVEYERSL
jgi:mono/diheme cytochrome c family protein